MPQPSYVHGASATPLIGETIGVRFDRIAERFAERDALPFDIAAQIVNILEAQHAGDAVAADIDREP